MRLVAGKRLRLTDEKSFAVVVSGRAEIYAVTKDNVSFRQLFLVELAEGRAAFPSLDGFERVDTLVYALTDTEIDIIPMTECPDGMLRKYLREWFLYLVDSISWMRLLADHGDDTLTNWRKEDFLKTVPADKLVEEFERNEQIFSSLVNLEFGVTDGRLERRMELRERHATQLMDEATQHLLGEDIVHGKTYVEREKKLEQTTKITRLVAHYLGLSTKNIELQPAISKKLDTIGLIRRLTQKGNISIRFISLEEDWYKDDSGAMIGWYRREGSNTEEPVAIFPESAGKYYLHFANNERIQVTDDIANNMQKGAFVCYPGLPSHSLTLRDLYRFMRFHTWKEDIRIIIIVSLLAGIIPLITPIITETIFKDIIPILDRQGLATVTQVSAVTAFTMTGFSVCRSIAMLRITTKLDMTVEAALWGRLLTLPARFFRRFTSGELLSRMMGLENAKNILSAAFVEAILGLIFSFWSILLMCYYDLKLTAIAVVIWTVFSALEFLILKNIEKLQQKFVEAKNMTAGVVQQIFTGLSKFRIQGSEAQAYYLWSKFFGKEWNYNQSLRWKNNYIAILTAVQPFVLMFAIYYIAFSDNAKAILSNEPGEVIPYATFMAFCAAYTGLNTTLTKALPMITQFFALKPLFENLEPILKETPEYQDDKIDADILTGAVEVKHLSFSYKEGMPDVLHDISFNIKAGENIAIVGKSGCGKSTLLRLLLGFEHPKQGAIVFDGQDLSELDPTSVRSQMGIVLQNGQLMSGDILTNIVGQSTLTEKDAWEAAEAAGVAEDIRQMPMGMQTIISEGSGNISGGQRQRILIARALASKPAFIIFDEATSALDNRAQAMVTESLNKLKTTRIIVAHRLSTIRECDRILVIDKGRIAESGSFNELVNKNGIFSTLVKRQVA